MLAVVMNCSKSTCMHFRSRRLQHTEYIFHIGDTTLDNYRQNTHHERLWISVISNTVQLMRCAYRRILCFIVGYKSYKAANNIWNIAMGFFMGVHRFAPVPVLIGDTGWIPARYRCWVAMIQFWNHLFTMDFFTNMSTDNNKLMYFMCQKPRLLSKV